MKALVIQLDTKESKEGVKKLKESIKRTKSPIELKVIKATTPQTVVTDLSGVKTVDCSSMPWNWPDDPRNDGLDMMTGLWKATYRAADQNRVVACTVSHVRCWDKVVQDNEPYIVFEHDAILTRKLDAESLLDQFNGILGLNDPRNATRKAGVFHSIASKTQGVQNVPTVDHPSNDKPLPMGLAGNSAYIIKPKAAKLLLDRLDYYKLWPNDAYMNKQLFPWLKIVYPYYTKVQGTPSTTTG